MDLYLAPGPHAPGHAAGPGGLHHAGPWRSGRGGPERAAARDALRSARYEDQHQLPLARLEILLALDGDGPAAALAAASAAMDRFDLSGGSPRYAWPVVTAGASAVLAAARQAGVAHDERLADEAAALADRLRTVAEKLGTFGPAQRAFQLTFTAADAHVAPCSPPAASPRNCSPPGTMPPPRGPTSASPIRWPRRCCRRRRPRWPAATATARRNGCSARPRWRPGWARTRSASRSRSSRGAPGSGWPATRTPRPVRRAIRTRGAASSA